MKTYELFSENSWKELTQATVTEEQKLLLASPDTEENRQTKVDLIAEIHAASKIDVPAEKVEILDAVLEAEKNKIENLSADFKLVRALIFENENHHAGSILYTDNNAHFNHEFSFPLTAEE